MRKTLTALSIALALASGQAMAASISAEALQNLGIANAEALASAQTDRAALDAIAAKAVTLSGEARIQFLKNAMSAWPGQEDEIAMAAVAAAAKAAGDNDQAKQAAAKEMAAAAQAAAVAINPTIAARVSAAINTLKAEQGSVDGGGFGGFSLQKLGAISMPSGGGGGGGGHASLN